jgi:hypothetical protein
MPLPQWIMLSRNINGDEMTVLSRIAFFQERRDEVPNQQLARELAASKNSEGIREIAEHLWDRNNNVRSDCLKVLYEIGYLEPKLIAPYVDDFVKLLISKQNRLVWGSMIGLAAIADLEPKRMFEVRNQIKHAMETGSVITMDNGIKVLAKIAAAAEEYQKDLSPYLLDHLQKCRVKEVPQHAESILVCINKSNQADFLTVLMKRLPEMIPSQAVRIRKIQKALS